MKNRHWVDKWVEAGLAAWLLLWASGALAQTNSDQIKKKTDGGIVGDTSKALAVGIVRASSAPGTPVTGQLWCDTTLSPCTLKQYTGSVWVAPQVNAAITTQTDVTTFPGAPVDGQIFYSKTERMLWVYNSTDTFWHSIGSTVSTSSGASIINVYTGTLVTAPGALTATASATAGSLAAGTYSYKVTCRTASGGETTAGSVSNTITSLVNKSADLSSIPTCSGGTTTNRNIYRTKVNQAVSGPWYWVKNINDNSTTTGINDGLADASAFTIAPDVNFSAPLPGAWAAINNTPVTTQGGCGGTGTSRATMACWGGDTGSQSITGCTACGLANGASDANMVRASLDISAYSTGAYTLQYRVTKLAFDGDTYPTIYSPAFLGMRVGVADNAIRIVYANGGGNGGVSNACPTNLVTMPYSSSNHGINYYSERTAIGGTPVTCTAVNNPFPQIDAVPFWVRFVRKGGFVNGYISPDGIYWGAFTTCSGTTNTSGGCSVDSTNLGGTNLDHVEIPVANGTSGNPGGTVGQRGGGWIEMDNFTLTVNP